MTWVVLCFHSPICHSLDTETFFSSLLMCPRQEDIVFFLFLLSDLLDVLHNAFRGWDDKVGDSKANCHWALENMTCFPGPMICTEKQHGCFTRERILAAHVGTMHVLWPVHLRSSALVCLCHEPVSLWKAKLLLAYWHLWDLHAIQFPRHLFLGTIQNSRHILVYKILIAAFRFTCFGKARKQNKAFLHGWYPLENLSFLPSWKKNPNLLCQRFSTEKLELI